MPLTFGKIGWESGDYPVVFPRQIFCCSVLEDRGESMFSMRFSSFVSLMALFFATSSVAVAGTSDDLKLRIGEGDPAAGKEKSAMCQGCHGEVGLSADSNYPKLAGQFATYIQKQVHAFQDGDRKDPMMSVMSQSAGSDQDILDIAAYFAS